MSEVPLYDRSAGDFWTLERHLPGVSQERCMYLGPRLYACVRGGLLVRFLHGYVAHKKQRPPRTLQKDYALGPMVVLGGGAASYERNSPVVLISGT